MKLNFQIITINWNGKGIVLYFIITSNILIYQSLKTNCNNAILSFIVSLSSRVGFAKIAIEAKVPIIPVFTKNVREAFRTVSLFR